MWATVVALALATLAMEATKVVVLTLATLVMEEAKVAVLATLAIKVANVVVLALNLAICQLTFYSESYLQKKTCIST